MSSYHYKNRKHGEQIHPEDLKVGQRYFIEGGFLFPYFSSREFPEDPEIYNGKGIGKFIKFSTTNEVRVPGQRPIAPIDVAMFKKEQLVLHKKKGENEKLVRNQHKLFYRLYYSSDDVDKLRNRYNEDSPDIFNVVIDESYFFKPPEDMLTEMVIDKIKNREITAKKKSPETVSHKKGGKNRKNKSRKNKK